MSTVAPIRRNLKNVIKNYSEAQVKVREATSNDPWGPSSSLMTEIADYTYNIVAFSEIMQMIWKRLNDNGKNWRHVYKALSLLEYIIKTGNEKVAQQCKENIFTIQTLKDFQYIEENKDQGLNVREKAKQIVSLLKDDERLKNERTRALKAKERFAQSTSMSYKEKQEEKTHKTKEWDSVRPTNSGEEELQLQLAIAMSKEEAENDNKIIKGDDLRLQMALSQSEQEIKIIDSPGSTNGNTLLDIWSEENSTNILSNTTKNDRDDNFIPSMTYQGRGDHKKTKAELDLINLDHIFSIKSTEESFMPPSYSIPLQQTQQESIYDPFDANRVAKNPICSTNASSDMTSLRNEYRMPNFATSSKSQPDRFDSNFSQPSTSHPPHTNPFL